MPTIGMPNITDSSIDRIKKISSLGVRRKHSECVKIKELIVSVK